MELTLLLIGLGILSVGFYCYALGTPVEKQEEEVKKNERKK